MPNAKVLSEKQAIVAALAERIKNAEAGVLVDYKGITVAEDTALRTELRKDEVNPRRIPSLRSVSWLTTARSWVTASTSRLPSWRARS